MELLPQLLQWDQHKLLTLQQEYTDGKTLRRETACTLQRSNRVSLCPSDGHQRSSRWCHTRRSMEIPTIPCLFFFFWSFSSQKDRELKNPAKSRRPLWGFGWWRQQLPQMYPQACHETVSYDSTAGPSEAVYGPNQTWKDHTDVSEC